MTQDGPEAGAQIRPRPVRIVIIALLAAVALTLAYPMSARKTARGEDDRRIGAPGGAAASEASRARQADPQLSFSMRTVVRPAEADTGSARQKPVAHPADSAPKFEGYVQQQAVR